MRVYFLGVLFAIEVNSLSVKITFFLWLTSWKKNVQCAGFLELSVCKLISMLSLWYHWFRVSTYALHLLLLTDLTDISTQLRRMLSLMERLNIQGGTVLSGFFGEGLCKASYSSKQPLSAESRLLPDKTKLNDALQEHTSHSLITSDHPAHGTGQDLAWNKPRVMTHG